MILGCDVHAGYDVVRPIDWQACKDAGVAFAIPKCSVGNDPQRDDRSFKRNVAGAKSAGIAVGAYHFFYGLPSGEKFPPGRSGREQAERAWAKSEELGGSAGELPPALDLEWPPHFERDETGHIIDRWEEWETSANIIVDGALEYLDRMRQLSGRVPMVYSYLDELANLATAHGYPDLGWYPLWLALYPRDLGTVALPPDGRWPKAPAPWSKVSIWQFSADGSPAKIPGISACPIDRDCILDEETLKSLTSTKARTLPSPGSDDDAVIHPRVPLPPLRPPREV